MASLFSFPRSNPGAGGRRRGLSRVIWPWGADNRAGDTAVRQGNLSALVEREIIPRLVAAHPHDSVVTLVEPPKQITAEDIAAFTPLTVTAEADVLLDFVERLIGRGVPVETVLVELLAPAARRLGDFWEDDRCDFVDVTMGLWRLQEVVHELSGRVPAVKRPSNKRRAPFCAVPGEQHSFGAVVLDDIFMREGWLTERLTEPTTPELLARIATEWFDVIGLTVSCDSHISALPSLIRAIRNVSANARVGILVGGRVFLEDPARAAEVGADGTASDARKAVKLASKLVGAKAQGVTAGA